VQGEEVISGLENLLRHLVVVRERRAASPAMRLLDDLLQDLCRGSETAENCRIEDAVHRMECAFSFQSRKGFDIIQLAAALAGEAPPLPEDRNAPEYVARDAFVREVAGLVEEVEVRQLQREDEITQMEVSVPSFSFFISYVANSGICL
jgi:hypothetical protein